VILLVSFSFSPFPEPSSVVALPSQRRYFFPKQSFFSFFFFAFRATLILLDFWQDPPSFPLVLFLFVFSLILLRVFIFSFCLLLYVVFLCNFDSLFSLLLDGFHYALFGYPPFDGVHPAPSSLTQPPKFDALFYPGWQCRLVLPFPRTY